MVTLPNAREPPEQTRHPKSNARSKRCMVVVEKLGRNSLVSANWALPWAAELRSILVQTVGLLGRLSDQMSEIDGITEAFVFGSWAARHHGEVGPSPADVDVLVVGEADLRSVRRQLRAVEADLRVEVNPVVVGVAEWASSADDPFLAEIRSRPLTPIDVIAA